MIYQRLVEEIPSRADMFFRDETLGPECPLYSHADLTTSRAWRNRVGRILAEIRRFVLFRGARGNAFGSDFCSCCSTARLGIRWTLALLAATLVVSSTRAWIYGTRGYLTCRLWLVSQLGRVSRSSSNMWFRRRMAPVACIMQLWYHLKFVWSVNQWSWL
jgi:hypothetical protein